MPLIQDTPRLQPMTLTALLEYAEGDRADKTLVNTAGAAIFLLALDAGQSVPEHAPPGDALMQILEGEVRVMADGSPIELCVGQALVIPAGAKRSPIAKTKAKLLITLIKQLAV